MLPEHHPPASAQSHKLLLLLLFLSLSPAASSRTLLWVDLHSSHSLEKPRKHRWGGECVQKMGVTSPLKGQSHSRSLTRKLLPYVLYALLPIAVFRFYFHPFPSPLSTSDQLPHPNRIILTTSSSSPPPSSFSRGT